MPIFGMEVSEFLLLLMIGSIFIVPVLELIMAYFLVLLTKMIGMLIMTQDFVKDAVGLGEPTSACGEKKP